MNEGTDEKVRGLSYALERLVIAIRAYAAPHRIERCRCKVCNETRAAVAWAETWLQKMEPKK